MSPEQELIDITAFQNGDREAGDRLFRDMEKWVRSLCKKFAGQDKEQADEYYAAVQIKILEYLYEFDVTRGTRLITYLYNKVRFDIQREEACESKRRNVPRYEWSAAISTEAEDTETDNEYRDLEEFYDIVSEIIEGFSDIAQKIIQLKTEGRSIRKIARALHIEPKDVDQILREARIEITKELKTRDVEYSQFIGDQEFFS